MSKSISRFNHLLVLNNNNNNNNNKKDNSMLYNIYYDQLALTLWQFSDCDAVRRMCRYNVHNITMSLLTKPAARRPSFGHQVFGLREYTIMRH